MTHRADQIIDRVAALHEARAPAIGVKVFTHRRISLLREQDNLPAYSIDIGPEQGVAQNTQYIDSLMLLPVSSLVVANDEPAARKLILSMRRESAIALMADRQLGLGENFVISTTFAAVREVETSVDGGEVVLVQTVDWQIFYRMHILDPGDN